MPISNSQLEGFKNQIWKVLSVLRGEVSPNDFHISLFLLSLYNDGALQSLIGTSQLERKLTYDKLVYENLLEHNETLEDLYDEIYSNAIKRISYNGFYKITEALFEINLEVLNENYVTYFETQLSLINENIGRYEGQFHTPIQLSRFAFSLVNLPENAKIYNPFAGLATYSTFLSESQKYYGQEINTSTYGIGILRFFAHKKFNNSNFENGDSIFDWNPNCVNVINNINYKVDRSGEKLKYDLVIANPPFALKIQDGILGKFGNIRNVESFLIEKGIDSLNDTGKLVALVSTGNLFRQGTEHELRKSFVNEDLLETVISFPSGLLQNTGVNIAIIVLNKVKQLKGKVKFVDASAFIQKKAKNNFEFKSDELLSLILSNEESAHVRIVPNTIIEEYDYDLNVNQFFQNIPFRTKLGEITNNDKSFSRNFNEDQTSLKRINFSDLNNNIKVDYTILRNDELKRNDFILNDSCFLFGTFNGQLKFTFFEFTGEPHSCSSNMIPLKIDERKVTVPYFAKQLTESYFIDQFVSFSKGTAIQKVSKVDLLKIVVSVPLIAEQERQHDRILSYFNDTSKNLELMTSLEDQLYEQTVFLRHSIAGPTRNVLSFMKKMMHIIDNNPNSKIGDISTIKLKSSDRYNFIDMRKIVERDLIKIENVVKNQLDIQQQISDSKLDAMDIDVFLSDYTHNLKEVHPQINISYESFVPYLPDDIDKEEYVTIYGNQELLSTMIDNLFENARQHAFQENLGKKFLVNLNQDEDTGKLSIEVANSGKGFPKDIDFKGFIAKNKKSNDSLGNGFGGWFINQVIRHHKGNLEIDDISIFRSEIADGYTTSFHIQLPLAQE